MHVCSWLVGYSHLYPLFLLGQLACGQSWKLFFLWLSMAAWLNWMGRRKVPCLACWNADGVHGRMIEMEHFLSQHDVHICLPSETILSPVQAFWLNIYVCHCTDRITPGGDTAVLVRQGIVHHDVSILGLTHLEAIIITVMMTGRVVKILAAYPSPPDLRTNQICLLVSAVDYQP